MPFLAISARKYAKKRIKLIKASLVWDIFIGKDRHLEALATIHKKTAPTSVNEEPFLYVRAGASQYERKRESSSLSSCKVGESIRSVQGSYSQSIRLASQYGRRI